jgi:hypothetical protein
MIINMPNGALRAPPPIAASYLHPKTFPPARTPELSIGLSCTLLSYICILLSYAGAP